MNRMVIAARRALDLACGQLVTIEEGTGIPIDEYMAKKEALINYCLERGEVYADAYIAAREKILQGESEPFMNWVRRERITEVTPKGIDPGNWEKARRVSESMSRRFNRSVYDKIDEDLLDQEPGPKLESNVIQLSEVIQQEGDTTFFDPNETMYPEEEFDFAPLSKRLTIDSKASLKRKRPQLVADQESEE